MIRSSTNLLRGLQPVRKNAFNKIPTGILRSEKNSLLNPTYKRRHPLTQRAPRHQQNDTGGETLLVAKIDRSRPKQM